MLLRVLWECAALYGLYDIELEDQRTLELKMKNKVKKLQPKKQKMVGKINDKSNNTRNRH